METFSKHPATKEIWTQFPFTKAMTRLCTLSYDELTHPKSWPICVRQTMACSYILSHDKRMRSKPCQRFNHSWIQDCAWKGKHQCCHPQENCSWHAPLKNVLLELALNIDVKQLKKSQAGYWKSIPKIFEWNLSTMWKLEISGIETNDRNCCARDVTTLHWRL